MPLKQPGNDGKQNRRPVSGATLHKKKVALRRARRRFSGNPTTAAIAEAELRAMPVTNFTKGCFRNGAYVPMRPQ